MGMPSNARFDHSILAEVMEDGREVAVAAALPELDLEARRMFALRYRSLLRIEEIAQTMQVTPRYVRWTMSSGLTMAREHLAGFDPTFRAVPDAELVRLLRCARRADLLPGLRRWADGKILGDLREASEQRRRVSRSVRMRRAMRGCTRLAEDRAFWEECVEEAKALENAGDPGEAEDLEDEAGMDVEDAA